MENTTLKLYTMEEAIKAGLVDGLTKWRLREIILDGSLPVMRAGKRYLFTAENLIDTIKRLQAPLQ